MAYLWTRSVYRRKINMKTLQLPGDIITDGPHKINLLKNEYTREV